MACLPGAIAPLVAPAVDLSVLALPIAVRHLAMHGVSRRELAPARRLLVASCLTTLALNVAEPMINGEYGRAGFDCVGPLLLTGWSHVGPELLGAIHMTQVGRGGQPAALADAGARSTATAGSIVIDDGHPESVVEPARRATRAAGRARVHDRLVAAARQVDDDHWAAYGRPASAETLRRHLRVGSATARRLKDQVRAHLRPVIDDPALSVGVSA